MQISTWLELYSDSVSNLHKLVSQKFSVSWEEKLPCFVVYFRYKISFFSHEYHKSTPGGQTLEPGSLHPTDLQTKASNQSLWALGSVHVKWGSHRVAAGIKMEWCVLGDWQIGTTILLRNKQDLPSIGLQRRI